VGLDEFRLDHSSFFCVGHRLLSDRGTKLPLSQLPVAGSSSPSLWASELLGKMCRGLASEQREFVLAPMLGLIDEGAAGA
jgi:hypothetical protein